MKIAGEHTIAAPREEVWEALHDPAVLARTLPGCNQLRETDQDCYEALLTAGVASVRGTYEGEVRLTGKDAPHRYSLHASGSGTPGTIAADADVELTESEDGTVVSYDADAIVGGMLGGVGQRMIVAVAKRTAGEFFTAVERELVEGPPEDHARPDPAAADDATSADVTTAGDEAGRVFAGTAGAAGSGGGAGVAGPQVPVLVAAVVGAVIALAGVLVGRRLAR